MTFQSDNDYLYQKWKNILQQLDSRLQNVIQSTETEFLSIGDRLNYFSLEAKEISKITLSAANFLNGEEIVGAIEGLQDMLNRISRYLNYCEEELKHNMKILEKTLNMIEVIYKPLEEFEKIVKMLRILGVFTRIESARLNSKIDNFNNLANAIRNLSNLIKSKLDSIENGSESLRQIIKQRMFKISVLEDLHYNQNDNILTNINKCLSSLNEKYKSSSQTTKSISGKYNNISSHIEEVVTSMQFHDITRQKIEHVKEALNDLVNHFNPGNNNDDEINFIKRIAGICELQAFQLNQAKMNILSAINDIISNLRGIINNISNISREAQEMVLVSEKDRKSFFGQIETGILDVKSFLSANARVSLELTTAMKSVAEMVNDMGKFVNDIENIGSEIKLIALNGLVNAAHMGEEGAAISVLAESIQKLSVSARQHINAMSDMLKKITTTGNDLRFGIDTMTDKNGVENIVSEIINNLEELLNSIRQVNNKVASSLNHVDTTVRRFAINIENAINEITVQNIFDKQLSNAIVVLKEVAEQAQQLLPSTEKLDKLANLKELQEKYTMDSEREIHQYYLDSNGDKIFSASGKGSKDAVVPAADNKAGDDLGDNVELF